MDRIRLRHVLTHLHDVITNDIPGLSFRMWFYGSRQRGTEHADSDVDLAIETLSPMEDGFLSGELGLAVQIELYRGLDFTPAVHAALEESSEVIYESAPTPSE
jgi:predicted nucleotidyltransferase